ncbi:outer membrane transport energization protein ExbB [Ectopseudomonas oleovorans]|uniref:Biopolymer transport protein ExbB n=1 Tax=Ectopseudomonas oleovorans TaxID=301 RepID=A0A397M7V4_ECTOL|nr:tonB-system energizer ExbB [Pseudomonas oleovorans]RIA21102.1 outer membrane transport energization protein ExbB [Pseudomonas oleovorans]
MKSVIRDVSPLRLLATLLLGLTLATSAVADEATPTATATPPTTSEASSNATVTPAEQTEIAPALPETALEEADMSEALAGHDLSPWGMYQSADVVVKSVMIGLLLASVLTWTIWLAKSIELLAAKRRLRREMPVLKAARTLKDAGNSMDGEACISHRLVQDALEEVKLTGSVREADGLKERVSFRLERLVAASGRQMSQGTGVLATIGSTAPFVGLFGTVWGIMNSFIGIAKSQTTNLAVVAPGIAEALLATALGLVAAIPAVVIYNVFARSIAGYKAQVADASAQVLLLVSRDLDHLPSERQAPHMVKVG